MIDLPEQGSDHAAGNGATSDTACRTDNDRRKFFARISIALSSLIAAVIGIPAVSYVLAPIFRRPPREWRPVGKVEDFAIGETVLVDFEDPSPLPWAGVTADTGAWIRREDAVTFVVFSINCRHLGCPVRWIAGAELFMCPCHGGVYYKDGEVAAGPPPQPLAKYQWRVQNGQVEIQTGPVPLMYAST